MCADATRNNVDIYVARLLLIAVLHATRSVLIYDYDKHLLWNTTHTIVMMGVLMAGLLTNSYLLLSDLHASHTYAYHLYDIFYCKYCPFNAYRIYNIHVIETKTCVEYYYYLRPHVVVALEIAVYHLARRTGRDKIYRTIQYVCIILHGACYT